MKGKGFLILTLLATIFMFSQLSFALLSPEISQSPKMPLGSVDNSALLFSEPNPGEEEPSQAIQALVSAMQEIAQHQGVVIPNTAQLGEILNEVDTEIRNLDGEWTIQEKSSTLHLNYGNQPRSIDVLQQIYTNGDISFTISRDQEGNLVRFEYFDKRPETVKRLKGPRLTRFTLLNPPQKIDIPEAPGGNLASLVVEDGHIKWLDIQTPEGEEVILPDPFQEVYEFKRLYFAPGQTVSFNEVPEEGEEILSSFYPIDILDYDPLLQVL